MKPFVHNRFIDSVIKTLLVYVLVHIVTMTVYVFFTGEYATLNAFRVLGLTLFFQGIDSGAESFVISLFFYGAIYCVVYLTFTKKS